MPTTSESIAALQPTSDEKIMDLVAEAGVDASPWSVRQDGQPVRNPRSNPDYCYEWAFGGEDEPTVLCIWHKDLKDDAGDIVFVDNVRDYALGLDRLAIDRAQPTHVRNRARDQAKRARKFDSKIQRAYRRAKPVRVVLLVGEPKEQEELGWGASKVKYRRLDGSDWYVHAYSDEDGAFRLVRDRPPPSAEAQPPLPAYVDQFEVPAAPERREAGGFVVVRSADVRRAVLARAMGKCELCGTAGFVMANGAIYLETHHVVSLAEDGPDVEWNVVGLCANDHRRAHFSAEQEEIKRRLVSHLLNRYPAASEAIRVLLAVERVEQA